MSSQVQSLLKNAKFAHLATSDPTTLQPNVVLMNYGYMPGNELFSPAEGTYLVFSVSKSATNFVNILKNPRVSVLIHDWVTAKTGAEGLSLLAFLHNMNQNELSTISATLNGQASVVQDPEEHTFYKKRLLELYPESEVFIGGDNKIVLIKIEEFKVVDTENRTEKY